MNFTLAQASLIRDVLEYVGECHYGFDEYEDQAVWDEEKCAWVEKPVRVLTTGRCADIIATLPNVPDEMMEDLMWALDIATTDAGDYPGSEEDEYSKMYVEPISELVYWKLSQLEKGETHGTAD